MVASLSSEPHQERVAEIPIIDLGPYLRCEPGALSHTSRQLRKALETVGFFIIINHGIPASLIAQTFEEARRFHDQSMETKIALRMNEHNNGYMAMGRYAVWTSDVNDNSQPDLNEAFFLRRERGANDPLLQSGRLYVGPNRWPENLPGFQEHILQYTDAMDELSQLFMPICASALDLPSDYFHTAFAESQFTFRLSHYPPVEAKTNQFGIAPHTDANFLTFLAQTGVPGLQIRMPDGAWREVPYVPNSFAVNSGDMMYRWTNGRFKSTPHRALPPIGQHRYAIPFFLGPHIDTMIDCLPTCQGADRPPRFKPMTYDAYLQWWYKSNYDASLQDDLDETPVA